MYTRAEYESQSENPKRIKVKCITECSALVTRQSAAVIYLSSQAQGDVQLCKGAGQRNVGSHSKAVQKWKLCQDCVSSMAKRWCSSMFFTKPRIKGSNSHSCAASRGFHFSSLLSFASLLSSRGKSCKRTEALAPSCRDIHFLLSINTQGTIHCPANVLQMVHVVWSRELQFSRQQWFAYSATMTTMSQAGAFLCKVETAGG